MGAYQALKEHSEKRELLEKSARAKLQGEIVNLGDVNKELKERHDAIMAQVICALTTSKLFRIGLFADDVGRYQQYTRS